MECIALNGTRNHRQGDPNDKLQIDIRALEGIFVKKIATSLAEFEEIINFCRKDRYACENGE